MRGDPAGEPTSARAVARSNIALAKYWGKAHAGHNIPAVPSLSMTLDELVTETEVRFDPSLGRDELSLDGRPGSDAETRRVVSLLNRVRAETGTTHRASVATRNRFPTAAGLASSASGFAALAAAARAGARGSLEPRSMSALARRSSASAARSIYGGFVALDGGNAAERDPSAVPVAPPDYWDVRLVIALTDQGPKSVGSTEAMTTSKDTSPFYQPWVDLAPRLFEAVKAGVRARDLDTVGQAMEQSTLAFHACAMTSIPSVFYWSPGTISALRAVRQLRADRVPAWATMDAGPHVKVLCERKNAATVSDALERTSGVLEVIVASPGRGVEIQPKARI